MTMRFNKTDLNKIVNEIERQIISNKGIEDIKINGWVHGCDNILTPVKPHKFTGRLLKKDYIEQVEEDYIESVSLEIDPIQIQLYDNKDDIKRGYSDKLIYSIDVTLSAYAMHKYSVYDDNVYITLISKEIEV